MATAKEAREAHTFLSGQVTERVLRRDRETGDNFGEDAHLALGAAGYPAAEWNSESDGGFNRVRGRLWQLGAPRPRALFTTGAHICQYVFLLTNTDPDAPTNQSLTMFMVPHDSPGIEIHGKPNHSPLMTKALP